MNKNKLIKALISITLFTSLNPNAVAAVSLKGLGYLPGFSESSAAGVSADGIVVTGSSSRYGTHYEGHDTYFYEGFVWSEDTGLQSIGYLSDYGDDDESDGSSVSGDGQFVTGETSTSTNLGFEGFQAFRYNTSSGSLEGIGYLPDGTNFSVGTDISYDGSVITGIANTSTFLEGRIVRAFRWSENDGIKNLGTLPGGGTASYGFGVSNDGSVIVGSAGSANAIINRVGDGNLGVRYGFEAFIWNEDDGMKGLGFLDSSDEGSSALGVNGNGTVVVGSSYKEDLLGTNSISPWLSQAYRWTEKSGMIGLGELPGGDYDSRASDVSDDGNVIVGRSSAENGDKAFRWTKESGMITVEQWLEDAGLQSSQFTSLAHASGVSADGNTIVGTGINSEGKQEAFIATVIMDGTSPLTPLLPNEINEENGIFFGFDFVPVFGEMIYIDPEIAIGYDYEITAGSNLITHVELPVLPEDLDGYEIFMLGDNSQSGFIAQVMGGQIYKFDTPLSGFTVLDIESAAMLDPNDQQAFVTGLTFADNSAVSMTQTPITTITAVPEPETYAMFLAGLGLVITFSRKRKLNA